MTIHVPIGWQLVPCTPTLDLKPPSIAEVEERKNDGCSESQEGPEASHSLRVGVFAHVVPFEDGHAHAWG